MLGQRQHQGPAPDKSDKNPTTVPVGRKRVNFQHITGPQRFKRNSPKGCRLRHAPTAIPSQPPCLASCPQALCRRAAAHTAAATLAASAQAISLAGEPRLLLEATDRVRAATAPHNHWLRAGEPFSLAGDPLR